MRFFCVAAAWSALAGAPVALAQTIGAGKLTHVQSVTRQELQTNNHLILSADGRFVYTTSWRVMSVCVFSRDAKTGRVEHVQTVTSPRLLDGVTHLAISPDGRLAATAAFRSQAVALFARDPATGRLRLLDSARNGAGGVTGLVFAVEAAFSTDGKFVYALGAKHAPVKAGQPPNRGAIVAFAVANESSLRWVESKPGQDDCFNDVRGAAVHPGGKWLYVAAAGASCVVSLERDATTGKIALRQIIHDGQEGANGLAGAITPEISPDGRFLYVNSGRFSGDSGLTMFSVGAGGDLKFVEDHRSETGEVKNYLGGSGIAVPPDGRNLYATASRSGSLACFARDPRTGKLSYQETLADNSGAGDLGGAAGIAMSPDGRFVYIAAESDNTLTVLERK